MRLTNEKIASFLITSVFCLLFSPNRVHSQIPPVEGSPCTENLDCLEDTTFLECSRPENVCKCKNPGHTYFDQSDGQCHLLVNEDCEYDSPGLPPCPVNGWCDPVISFPPICQCLPTYSETAGRKCAIPYSGPCANDLDCDRDAFISCLGSPKTCGCDGANSVYDEERRLCVLKLHENCFLSMPEVPAQECLAGADCREDSLTCECLSELIDIGVGECRVNLGGACDASRKCNELAFLECGMDGICECGQFGWFDSTLGTCVSVAGADCLTDAVAPQKMCGFNSYCKNKTETGTEGVCTCVYDLRPNPQGLCFLEPGQSCQPVPAIDLCDKIGFQYCDPLTVHCACIPLANLIVESATRCRLMADSPCSNDQPPCTTNSQCLDVGDTPRCVCNDGLVINNVGKCSLLYGATCSLETTETCNGEGFQFCNPTAGNICTCFDEEVMVFGGDKCYLKADTSCIPGFECTPNSACDGDKRCSCDAGFHNENGFCVASM